MQKKNGSFSGLEEEQPKKQPEAILCHYQTLWVSCQVNKIATEYDFVVPQLGRRTTAGPMVTATSEKVLTVGTGQDSANHEVLTTD